LKTDKLHQIIRPLSSVEKVQFNQAITFYSRFYYYAFHQLYAAIQKKDSFQIKLDILQLWESHPHMEEKNIKAKDLVPLLGSKSYVSQLLNKKKPLTAAIMRVLYQKMGIPAEILLAA
jgi:hypothetical protein